MSQIQSFLESAGPGPGPVLSLTGDTGGAVGPDGTGNINILGQAVATTGFGTLIGNALANTLEVLPLITPTITTIDATNTTIFALTLPNNSAVVIRALIIGVRNDFSSVYSADWVVPARKNGIAAVTGAAAAGSEPTDYVGNPPPASGIAFSATQALVRVRGTEGQTWNWTAQISYQFVV